MSSSTRRAKLLTSAVFFLAFLRLAWQADSTGIASGYIDPVARIAAQDEAVYTHTSIRMATQGGWLTPKFLGRFAFYKPPLLYWLSASAGRLFGISPLALRIPSVVGGAAVAALVFWWALRMEGLVAGIGAVLLLGSTYLWYTLGSLNLTDMLLTCCITAAALCLFVDPQLRRRHVWLGLAFAIAGALMTKGVAGAVPLLICAGVWFSASESTRMIRIAQVVGLAAAFALPWYVYQLMAHPRWFWAEFVLLENLSFGLGSPPQTTSEGQLQFYLRRLVLLDLPLLCAAIAALPLWWKRKGHDRVVLIAWMTAMGLAILGFRYRNAAYLLPLMPALCLWAAPVLKWRPVSFVLIPAILVWRGVPFKQGTTLSSAPPLREYCQQSRSKELLIVAPDDEFYASVLPLSRVRYVYLETKQPSYNRVLDFRHLGITVSAGEFHEMTKWAPLFTKRLHDWGYNTAEPLATVILASNGEQVAALIRSHPESDFYVPSELVPASNHEQRRLANGRTLLLSRQTVEKQATKWTCEM